MSKVLFVAYGGGHVSMLIPIARELRRLGRPFTFLGLTSAGVLLRDAGIPFIGFRDLPESNDEQVQKWGRQLAKGLPSGGIVDYEESVAYLGLSFRDLAQQVGENAAWRNYAKAGRHAFFPLSTLRKTIKLLSPSLVVATNSPRAERAAIEAAGQLALPSICLVDLFALREVQWIGKPGYATKICVLNDSVRKMFVEHGRQAHEVVITGNPAFDQLTAPAIIAAGAQLRCMRGWNDGRRVILWASQFEPERHPFADLRGDPTLPRRIEQVLRDLVAADSGLRLVVRYHPNEQVAFVPSPNVEFSPVTEPISTLLHAVDVVVVTASTVGLEASIAGRPVVSVDASIFTPDTRYSQMGISRGVDRVEDLAPKVLQSLLDRSTILSHGQPAKSATQEILRVIDSLLI
jgi:hypothetical protein